MKCSAFLKKQKSEPLDGTGATGRSRLPTG
jgi:hypothetical protein